MKTKINLENGVIYLWFDKTYLKKRNGGLSKVEIEKNEVKSKIQTLFPTAVLEHEENGAPIIRNTLYTNISISHYQGWFAVYFSNTQNGVDVQTFKKSLLKGKDYFINEKDGKIELNQLNLHLIWCAKEAFYKMKKGNIVDLKNDVSILAINDENNCIYLFYKASEYRLNFKVHKDCVIVWT